MKYLNTVLHYLILKCMEVVQEVAKTKYLGHIINDVTDDGDIGGQVKSCMFRVTRFYVIKHYV